LGQGCRTRQPCQLSHECHASCHRFAPASCHRALKLCCILPLVHSGWPLRWSGGGLGPGSGEVPHSGDGLSHRHGRRRQGELSSLAFFLVTGSLLWRSTPLALPMLLMMVQCGAAADVLYVPRVPFSAGSGHFRSAVGGQLRGTARHHFVSGAPGRPVVSSPEPWGRGRAVLGPPSRASHGVNVTVSFPLAVTVAAGAVVAWQVRAPGGENSPSWQPGEGSDVRGREGQAAAESHGAYPLDRLLLTSCSNVSNTHDAPS